MRVDICLIPLTLAGTELALPVSHTNSVLPRVQGQAGNDPDAWARRLALEYLGIAEHIHRHGFLSASDGAGADITLVYHQLLPAESLNPDLRIVPVRSVLEAADLQRTFDDSPNTDHVVVRAVVRDLKANLGQVMHSRENRQGLIHLLELLPEIFDHKELAAAYMALAGDKPASAVMLARMMLDRYTIGSGEKAREVQGRNLIREYGEAPPELLGEKWEKNRELYRTGGPKVRRLYRKNVDMP